MDEQQQDLTPEQAADLPPDDPNVAASACDDDPESLIGEELGYDDEVATAVLDACLRLDGDGEVL